MARHGSSPLPHQGTRSYWRRSSELPWWLNTRRAALKHRETRGDFSLRYAEAAKFHWLKLAVPCCRFHFCSQSTLCFPRCFWTSKCRPLGSCPKSLNGKQVGCAQISQWCSGHLGAIAHPSYLQLLGPSTYKLQTVFIHIYAYLFIFTHIYSDWFYIYISVNFVTMI